MSKRSRAGLAALVIACLSACGPARAPLPPASLPYTRTPDAAFRTRVPAPLPETGARRWPRARRHTLANGMRVIVVERHSLPLVSIRYVNWAATRGSGEVPGLAQLTGRVLLEGTHLADGSEATGLRVAGRGVWSMVSHVGTTVGMDVVAPARQLAVDTVARVVRFPVFAPGPVSVAASKLHAALSDESRGTETIAWRLKVQALYGTRHPWVNLLHQAAAALPNLTAPDIEAYHRHHFVPNASALVVVGDVRADEVLAQAEQVFGDWAMGPQAFPSQDLKALPFRDEVQAVITGGDQTRLSIVHPAPGVGDASFLAHALLTHILAGPFLSRANRVVRHHAGASYGVYGTMHAFRRASIMELGAAVDDDEVLSSVRALAVALEDIRQRGVPEDELEAARASCLAMFRGTSNRGIASLFAWQFHMRLGDDWLASLDQRLGEVTSQVLQALARDRLDLERAPLVVIGDAYRTVRQLRRLGDHIEYYWVQD